MGRELIEDLSKQPGQNSLAQNLNGGRVVPSAKRAAVDTFQFFLPQKARAELGLHEWPRVDLVIRLWNRGQSRCRGVYKGECESESGGLMSGVVRAKTIRCARNSFSVCLVPHGIGCIEIRSQRSPARVTWNLQRKSTIESADHEPSSAVLNFAPIFIRFENGRDDVIPYAPEM